jgi:hypothetical protein
MALNETTPGKPLWLMVAVQEHPPPLAAFVQLTLEKPSPDRGPPIPSQVVVVPEIIKQPAGSSMSAEPVVVVPSVYVLLAVAVHVPVTSSEPVSVTFLQLVGSRPASEMSRLLLESARHDELTVQVPTTLPPQAATLVQDPELPPVALPPEPFDPPLWPLPPEPVEPPLCAPPEPVEPPLCPLPPEPVWSPDWAQLAEMIPKASANAKRGDWAFIEVSLEPASGRLVRGIASSRTELSEKDRAYLL